MEESGAATLARLGSDLTREPHILPLLIKMVAGEWRQAFAQQELIQEHLRGCLFCCTAVVFLLALVKEVNRRENISEDAPGELITCFVTLIHEIERQEAHAYERLGGYAETLVEFGQDQAGRRFPDIENHLRTCSNCRLAVEATISFISETEGRI